MITLVSLLSGIIFSIGLVVSGMTNPDKVTGFLNLFGNWDYDLALVMGGAVIFNLLTFMLIKKQKKTILAGSFQWPTNKHIDKKLVIGASLFGIGWGLIGICPGPGIVNLVLLDLKVIVFVLSMLLGIVIFKFIFKTIKK